MRKASARRPNYFLKPLTRIAYSSAMDTNFLHITGNQAISLLRAARAKDIVTAVPFQEHRVQGMSSTLTSLNDVGASELLSWLNIGPQNPLQVLAPSASTRVWITGIKCTTISNDLPSGAFLELRQSDGKHAVHWDSSVRVLIDGPALATINAASRLQSQVSSQPERELESKLRLIALASEFCGRYARDPKKPMASLAHYDKVSELGRFTCPRDLQAFMQDSPKLDGLAYARIAAKYAIDESGSPMETYINHALTLPPRLAGLSMPKPLANKQLQINDEAVRSRLKHTSIRPDFQWPDFNTLAEYLGNKEHASRNARVEDKDRQQDYSLSDYIAYFLMFDDVRSVSALNRTAMMLARSFAKHGKKYEPYRIARLQKDPDFLSLQTRLVSQLLPPIMRYEQS